MILERIQAGIYAANCYLIGCEKTKLATIIDPGGDVDSILQLLEKHSLKTTFNYIDSWTRRPHRWCRWT